MARFLLEEFEHGVDRLARDLDHPRRGVVGLLVAQQVRDLDREAADLLRYQQAYNAATRVIQVARETVNAMFELF